VPNGQIIEPRANRIAAAATGFRKLAMHMDDAPCARSLVQVIDVLGDERKAPAALGERTFESGECEMRRVRLGVEQVSATQIVERQHRFGIAGERFGRRQPHRIELGPDPLAFLVAKGAKPALGRDAGAGENEDVARHALEPSGSH
jgi:hypothetical protein